MKTVVTVLAHAIAQVADVAEYAYKKDHDGMLKRLDEVYADLDELEKRSLSKSDRIDIETIKETIGEVIFEGRALQTWCERGASDKLP